MAKRTKPKWETVTLTLKGQSPMIPNIFPGGVYVRVEQGGKLQWVFAELIQPKSKRNWCGMSRYGFINANRLLLKRTRSGRWVLTWKK